MSTPPGEKKNLTVLHDAPRLNATRSCPSCNAAVTPEDAICTQCGTDLSTGEKAKGVSSGSAIKRIAVLGALAMLGAILAFFLWPETTPSETPKKEPAAEPRATPEEIARRQAEENRAAFETKKAQAKQNLIQQLDTQTPLYTIGDTVELRRKNGVFHKGTLQGFSGTGKERGAIVATSVGEVTVPLISLDNPSRRRVDADYRERFIQHLLSQKKEDGKTAPGVQEE